MAEKQKEYPYSSVLLYNLACDVAEMFKARITLNSTERVGFTTETYGRKTYYEFHIEKLAGKCLLAIETEGDAEQVEKDVDFMFAIVDGMLARLPATDHQIINYGG